MFNSKKKISGNRRGVQCIGSASSVNRSGPFGVILDDKSIRVVIRTLQVIDATEYETAYNPSVVPGQIPGGASIGANKCVSTAPTDDLFYIGGTGKYVV